MIDRYVRPYNRLQWQLTLSYALITVLVMLVIETSLLLAAELGILNALNGTVPLELQRLTPALARYLAGGTEDPDRLQLWLQMLSDLEKAGVGQSAVVGQAGETARAIVDRQGYVLAQTGPWPAATGGPTVGTALSGVLAGHPAGQRTQLNDHSWSLTSAAPVYDAEGNILGALCSRTVYDDRRIQIPNVQRLLLPGLCFAALVAGLASVLSGYLNARTLTRRLRKLAERAAQWSHGDFAVRVEDRSSDELGDLARQFNDMAEQIDSLLQARQELAAMDERHRLARDLHDSVKQQAFALAMMLSSVQANFIEKPEVAQGWLAKAETLAHQVQQELELLIHELRPTSLQGRGLACMLREYVTTWSSQYNIVVEVRIDDISPTPPDVNQALYRVVQEALANVARHSQASAVQVTLGLENETLVLRVADNGTGFDHEKLDRKGLGLHSMRERVEALGGTFGLKSGGQGTTITVLCRLPANGEDSPWLSQS